MIVSDALPSAPFADVAWDDDPDWDWNSAAEDSADDLLDVWSEAVERSRAVVAEELADHGSDALDETYALGPDWVSLRWVLVHMVEEYARHNGHADLLRVRRR